jgi:hypothetical protein
MIIGKWYKVTQVTATGEQNKKVKTYGKCIWIHPKNRFCVLEFDGGVRECFSQLELGVS